MRGAVGGELGRGGPAGVDSNPGVLPTGSGVVLVVADVGTVATLSGLTYSGVTLSNDLTTGKAGGGVVIGGTAVGDTLILRASSTALGTGSVIIQDPAANAIATFAPTLITLAQPLQTLAGSESTGGVLFGAAANGCRMYQKTSTTIGLAIGNTERGYFGASFSLFPQQYGTSVSLSALPFANPNDDNTGLLPETGDVLSLVAGGARIATCHTTDMTLLQPLVLPAGLVGAPSLKWTDADTGFYDLGSALVGGTSNGARCFYFGQGTFHWDANVYQDAAYFGTGDVGWFSATPVGQQTLGGTIVNNITAGGTTRQLDDFTGAVYATDSAAIRNNLYQLGEQVRLLSTGLRVGKFGLFT